MNYLLFRQAQNFKDVYSYRFIKWKHGVMEYGIDGIGGVNWTIRDTSKLSFKLELIK